MIIKKDHLWKTAFHKFLPYFVKFFFPDRYDEVDWTKKTLFLDKELNSLQLNSRPKNRVADVLVMLHLKNGKRVYVLLHIEIQGYYDADYTFRIHQMRYRIEDKFNANPVMLSIFTDDDPNFNPQEHLVETWGSGSKTFFNTYKVMDNPPSTYTDPDNPVALIMEVVYNSTQIKKASSDEDIMKLFLPIAKKLFSKNYSKEYIRFLISFIEAHVKFGESESYRKFEQKIENMAKVETTAEIASYFFDVETWLKNAKKESERNRKMIERERQERERERQERERERQDAVWVMLQQGINTDIIATVFKISVEDIAVIQKKYKEKDALA